MAVFVGLALLVLLTGCGKYYYTRADVGAASFEADSRACIRDVGIPSPNGRYALVTREAFQPCMEQRGWSREKKIEPGYGWYRGVEDDEVIDIEAGVAQPSAGAGRGSLSRQLMCRRTYLSGPDWRQRLPDYRACLSE
jgi:hypothetical protein